ncbi:MAG: hypothetical protein CFE37_00370 [Alphaproteobacteria bacterium PA4]|nr:MAG: hypothetical protein CFE37_00370 [Alphaproteobacteria bacterium PA4]
MTISLLRSSFGVVFAAVATLATVGVAAGPARADTPDAPRTRIVATADLDLSRPQGLHAAEQRLARAIRQVCAPVDQRDLAERQAARACATTALAAASPRIAELAAARGAGNQLATITADEPVRR